MDAMKYSMEADKYRSAYMPPSTLAMSMYSDPKYMDSQSKSYLERGYLDSTSALTKAYFESSKMYMDGKYNPDGSRPYPLDIGKMYTETSQQVGGNLGSPRSSDSPDTKPNQERQDAASTSSSTTTSSAGASPGGLPSYYPSNGMQQTSSMPGLLPMTQYSSQYPTQTPGGEFRRPLTVIFWPDRLWMWTYILIYVNIGCVSINKLRITYTIDYATLNDTLLYVLVSLDIGNNSI